MQELNATASPARDAKRAELADVERQLEPIPDSARTSTPLQQLWIWAGAEIKPVQWVLGAIGIAIGLRLTDTLIVLIGGNLIGMALFGFLSLMGQRTGVTQMVITRSSFGRAGARIPAAVQALVAFGWCALNTWVVLDLILALLGKLGIPSSTPLKVVLVCLIMVLQISIATVGIKAIATFEKWTVPLTLLVLVAMTVVAWTMLPVDWGHQGSHLEGAARISAMSTVMAAAGIGNGISWFAYASDYSRFVPRTVPPRRLWAANFAGMFGSAVWLGTLGATLATVSTTTDPGHLIVDAYGVLAIPILLLVLHAPIATNIVNLYSCSLALQAIDIRIGRKKLSLAIGVIATAITLYLIHAGSLGATLTNWLAGLVLWVTPWAAIVAVDFYVLRKKNVDVDRLFTDQAGGHRGINWNAVAAWLVGIGAAWLFEFGVPTQLQGYFATQLGRIDLSWLVGPLVAGLLFWALERFVSTPDAVRSGVHP